MRSRAAGPANHNTRHDSGSSSQNDADHTKIHARRRANKSVIPSAVGSVALFVLLIFFWSRDYEKYTPRQTYRQKLLRKIQDSKLATRPKAAAKEDIAADEGSTWVETDDLLWTPAADSSSTGNDGNHEIAADTLMSPVSDDRSLTACRYDGHCPTGTTCAVASSAKFGVCEPIYRIDRIKNPNSAASDLCVQACQKELEVDEHFYYEKWPVIEWTEPVESLGRPPGCTLVYHRIPEGNHWDEVNLADAQVQWREVPPSIIKWDKERFRHVIRVDPHLPNDLSDERWLAYCMNPCQSDADCATKRDRSSPGFVCVDGACQRNPVYWETATRDRMYLVSGASSGYFRGLENLAASARYWAPENKMVVYNLGGLSEDEKKTILSWKNVVALEWPDGVPKHYPAHVSIGKIYAWKPVVLNETVHKYKKIFWLDAGTTLAGPMDPIENVLERTGMMLVKGQDLAMKLSHPGTYEYFNLTKSTFQGGPHYGGGTQAHLYKSRYIDTVVIPNAKCAIDQRCISPSGSSLADHRYDQTTVSILAYHPKVRAPHYTEFLAASASQLKPDMRDPSFKFIWTARSSCSFYTELSQKGGIPMDKK